MRNKRFIFLVSFFIVSLCSAYAQLKVSILGDSYSTFYGYVQPENNLCWYGVPGEKKENDVTKVEQTWWWCLADSVTYVLECNNAYSGATVCNTGYERADYSDRSFITRMDDLGNPDIILVFGGTNDSWAGAPLGDFKYSQWTKDDLYDFRMIGFVFTCVHCIRSSFTMRVGGIPWESARKRRVCPCAYR